MALESQILTARRGFGSPLKSHLLVGKQNQQGGVTWPGSHSKSVTELGTAAQ